MLSFPHSSKSDQIFHSAILIFVVQKQIWPRLLSYCPPLSSAENTLHHRDIPLPHHPGTHMSSASILPANPDHATPPTKFLHILPGHFRSEKHTSELQSRGHLVCRLLLEKKNYTQLASQI